MGELGEGDMEIDQDLAEVLALDQGILDAFGMRVLSARDGACRMRCVVPEGLVNAGGFAHGSIAFSLLDTACAYAIRSKGRKGVTSNANLSYVKGAQGGSELIGEVNVVSLTRRVATLRGEMYLDQAGQLGLAAHGSFVFQLATE